MKGKKQPMKRGALQFCPQFPSRCPPALCGKASKVGRVYRATALQNTPPVCSILHRAPFSLAAPAKKKKKHFACFQTPASHAGGGAGRGPVLGSPGSSVRPWQGLPADSAAAERAVGSAVITPSASPIFCSSAQAYVRGVCVHVCMCRAGRFLVGEKEGVAHPCLPSQRPPA